jgi:hypothetical protein
MIHAKVWSRELTAAEVTDLKDHDTAGGDWPTDEDHLWLTTDDDSGTDTVTDRAGSANGTLTNFPNNTSVYVADVPSGF